MKNLISKTKNRVAADPVPIEPHRFTFRGIQNTTQDAVIAKEKFRIAKHELDEATAKFEKAAHDLDEVVHSSHSDSTPARRDTDPTDCQLSAYLCLGAQTPPKTTQGYEFVEQRKQILIS